MPVRTTALLALALCACGHAPVHYDSHPLGRGFFIAPLASGELVRAGWTGRSAPKPDDKADFYFVRDSDDAWMSLHSYLLDVEDDSTPAVQLLQRSFDYLTMIGMRLSHARLYWRSDGVLLSTAGTVHPLEVEDASAADTTLSIESRPRAQVYIALVRRGRQVVVVVAGNNQGKGVLPAEEALDFARRVRFQVSAR
jgi:hypothetical protein